MARDHRLGSKRLVAVSAAALVVATITPPAQAQDLAGVARMQQCSPPTADFVSLGAAPEVQGAIPLTAGMHRLWDLGVAWKDVNPAPGVFDWATLDAEIAQVEQSGSSALLVLGMTPSWAAANPNAGDPRWGLGTASPPRETSYWRDYVSAVVDRYGPRIKAYQVWNEANLGTFWAGNPEQMAQMTKEAYDIIKGKQPEAVVVAPSIGLRLAGRMRNFTRAFMGALSARGFPVDALSIHTYPAGTGGPADRVALVTAWQNIVVESVGGASPVLDLPVFDTEVNYGLAGPGPRPGRAFTDAEAANLIRQTYADSLALGIDATFWYLYTAEPFSVLGAQLWSGAPDALQAWASVSRAFASGSPCTVSAPTTDRFAVDAQLALRPSQPTPGTALAALGQSEEQEILIDDGRVGGGDWSVGIAQGPPEAQGSLTLSGTGFMPQSPIYVWAGTRFASYVLTDSTGAMTGNLQGIADERIQVNGFAPSGEVRSVTVNLANPRPEYPRKAVRITFSGTDLSAKSQRRLANYAQTSVVTDTALVTVRGPRIKDARSRARSIRKYLRAAGFNGEISIVAALRKRERATVRLSS